MAEASPYLQPAPPSMCVCFHIRIEHPRGRKCSKCSCEGFVLDTIRKTSVYKPLPAFLEDEKPAEAVKPTPVAEAKPKRSHKKKA